MKQDQTPNKKMYNQCFVRDVVKSFFQFHQWSTSIHWWDSGLLFLLFRLIETSLLQSIF